MVARPGSSGGARPGEVMLRLSPLRLPASARVRLQRISPRALYKEELGQVLAPLRAGSALADEVASFLAALVPAEPAGASAG